MLKERSSSTEMNKIIFAIQELDLFISHRKTFHFLSGLLKMTSPPELSNTTKNTKWKTVQKMPLQEKYSLHVATSKYWSAIAVTVCAQSLCCSSVQQNSPEG